MVFNKRHGIDLYPSELVKKGYGLNTRKPFIFSATCRRVPVVQKLHLLERLRPLKCLRSTEEPQHGLRAVGLMGGAQV